MPILESKFYDEASVFKPYLPVDRPARIDKHLLEVLKNEDNQTTNPYFIGNSWTTDAPFRETASAINQMKKKKINCVEMEAAALYALSENKNYKIICFAHLTNTMAQDEGDFEKGEEFGSIATLKLVSHIISVLEKQNNMQYA